MCLAIPGKVESVEYPFAIVDFSGTKKKVRIDLVDDVKPGEYVLVHVGFAIQKVDEEEAKKLEEMLAEILVE
ncbi:HypC/HybG/HupF family hydrogenase formation chaperone [Archaeoglobus veneficus]|uniref:Hydrogenase assembly chaperone hypC/hupF n=1 Tax=Archaeoglobus veneficus (strain DSM 11195 / SNP6) TaxID=693661 RepID=F2KNA1_ARCVS|nr:HypC/HybG/HupF family hydrogenase formation chaperone [Archaeoglobus veneficus]AEA46202.1 hydrogenase assembly chaperone hypC/hupF [Archaeoglobus veneficus SNP6]